MFLFTLVCPNCKLDSLQPSRPRSLERALHIFGFSPVRCGSCSRRFYVYRLRRLLRHDHPLDDDLV